MNKLQQEIIEIIEPYMCSNIKPWLLILNKKWDIALVYDVNYDDKNERLLLCTHWFWYINSQEIEIWLYKIIWHYDITAVLKYIYSKWYYWSYYSKNCIEFADKNCVDDQEDWTTEFSIKNKPLHLYTEEENKDLLQLLKKLWIN